jgi:hypothetical protein
MEAIEPIAVVTDCDGLLTALRQRVVDLDAGLERGDAGPRLPRSSLRAAQMRLQGRRRAAADKP